MHCACAQGDRPVVACKHLWATILAVDSGGLHLRRGAAGPFPPVCDRTGSGAPPTTTGNRMRTAMSTRPPTASRHSRAAVLLTPLLTGWKSQLQRLSEEMHVEATTTRPPPREREIFYEIDAAQGFTRQQLVVQTSQRQRRSNGQWGKRKPLKLRPGSSTKSTMTTTGASWRTWPGRPERAVWTMSQADPQTVAHRYSVSNSLAEVLLPLMCATGGAVVLGDDAEKLRPLEWDDGPPWELVVEVHAQPGRRSLAPGRSFAPRSRPTGTHGDDADSAGRAGVHAA